MSETEHHEHVGAGHAAVEVGAKLVDVHVWDVGAGGDGEVPVEFAEFLPVASR